MQRCFYHWRDEGLSVSINYDLVMREREVSGREASPTADVVDSRSVKTSETAGRRGYDAGKRIKGRERHIFTDTNGLLVGGVVHEANIHDRDGAPLVLTPIRKSYPFLRHVFANPAPAEAGRASQGPNLQTALDTIGNWTIEVAKRSDANKEFVVLPRRWVVERTFTWLNRNRRLAKDFEASVESGLAWFFMASTKLLAQGRAKRTNIDIVI